MGSSLIFQCKFCKLPLYICRKRDQRLIKPYKPRAVTQYFNRPEERYERAFMYAAGYYDKQNDIYRSYNGLTSRQKNDIYLSLPLCVWEDFMFARKMVHQSTALQYNLCDLPINQEYIRLLFDISAIHKFIYV